jgi:hypothetical protein
MARPFLVPFRRLLRLAGSRWRYSTPPPHGLCSYSKCPTKQLAQWYCSRLVFRRCLVQISSGKPSILRFPMLSPQPYRQMPGQHVDLGHDCFLPNSFQLIIHLSSYHMTLHSLATDSVVNYFLQRVSWNTGGIQCLKLSNSHITVVTVKMCKKKKQKQSLITNKQNVSPTTYQSTVHLLASWMEGFPLAGCPYILLICLPVEWRILLVYRQ